MSEPSTQPPCDKKRKRSPSAQETPDLPRFYQLILHDTTGLETRNIPEEKMPKLMWANLKELRDCVGSIRLDATAERDHPPEDYKELKAMSEEVMRFVYFESTEFPDDLPTPCIVVGQLMFDLDG